MLQQGPRLSLSGSLQYKTLGVAALLEVPCLSVAGARVEQGGEEIFRDINKKQSDTF